MVTRFSGFEIDRDRMELRGQDGSIAVEPQVFQLLLLLLENRDRVVTKEELIDAVWDGRIVSDAAITSRINLLRKALGDSGTAQALIRTYPKRGYRFVGEVELDAGEGATGTTDDSLQPPTRAAHSVVILPFRDLAPPAEQDFLAEGLTEEISVALSRSSDVAVIANRSAMAVQDVAPHVTEVGRVLSAQYVVQGSVQRAGGRVRVTATMVESESGQHLWADRFEGALDDIFDIQDRVARSIAAVLPVRIQNSVVQQISAPARNLPSNEAYLKAIWTLRQSGDVPGAIDNLSALLHQDPTHALAHAQLALLLGFSIFVTGQDDPDTRTRAVAHARQALMQNAADERVLAKVALAFLNEGDFARAMHHSDKALALNPHSVEVIHFRGCILNGIGAHEAALEFQDAAMRLDPLFPDHYFETVIEAHYLLGQYDKAIDVFSGWDRPHGHVSLTMAACHAMAGNQDAARHWAEDFRNSRPPDFRLKDFFVAMLRYHKLAEDRAHWREGFVRSGLWED